jgi:hypothetical protein
MRFESANVVAVYAPAEQFKLSIAYQAQGYARLRVNQAMATMAQPTPAAHRICNSSLC